MTQRETSQRKFEDVWPLAPLQEGLLFHATYDGEGTDVYTIQLAFDLDGRLDPRALRAAADTVVRRHANLRAGFRHRKSGKPVQVIAWTVDLPWTETDLSGLPEAARVAEADRLTAADRAHRFDVARAPLFRFSLLRLDSERYRFVFTCHHLLVDGWSMPLLLGELFRLYATAGDDSALPPVRPYRDYLQWVTTQDQTASRQAWLDLLAGVDEPTLVGTAAPDAPATLPETVTVEIPADLTAALSARARELDVTVNTVLQAVWGVVLSGLTGRDDVVFGSTVSGRPPELDGVESMVGLFINTVPVRVRLDPLESLSGLVVRAQDQQAGMMPHQYLGLADIQRDAGVGEMFDTLLVYENYPVDTTGLAESSLGLRLAGGKTQDASHYPLCVLAVHDGTRIGLNLAYRTDAFDASTVSKIGRQFLSLVDAFAHRPDTLTGRIELLPSAMRHKVLTEWNNTAAATPEMTVFQRFEQQVAATPDLTAVRDNDRSLTYAELDSRANKLARLLVADGVCP
jgi:hypothetical protein